MQDHLRLANYIPQVVNKGAADNIWHRNVLHIDITWDKNSALFVDSEKRETFLADVSDKIPDCYPLHQCWFIQGHIHHSNLCNMNITRQFMQMVRVNNETLRSTFYTEKSFSRDTHSRAVSVTRSRTILFMNNVGKLLKPAPPINTRSMLNGHEKHTLNTPSQTPLSILYQYKKQIPTSVQKTLFKVYIECLQMHILKHFMSNGQIKSADSLYIYVSIEQSILDLFLMEYGQLRLHLLNPESVSHLPMKLIHREQVAAVYCKTQLKCYDQVKVYLDYPQYAVQVQMNHTYINLSLHAIIPLERDVKMSKAETVLTLKRKIIPFDIVDAISEYFWEYMDTLDENRINPCHEHCVTDYEDHPDLYIQFIECFREYFTQEFTILNQDGLIDWYTMKQIRMNKRCGCTFPMSNLDLFDSCIYPAIEQVTPIIYASLTNSCLFKKYKVTYLVMMGNLMDLKGCPSTYTQVANRLKESIEYQRKYHNDIHVEWIDQSISSTVIKGVRHITKNPLSGLLEQIYAGTYKLRSRDLFPKNVFGSNEEDHPLIMEGTRITEKMREDGASLYLNVKVKDIQAGKKIHMIKP
ncbi:hypothetical protein BDB01DRAFT_389959 [Pilobolus umbonatus]|nr:hypothetical protein BDB01DRAFT_389959 [Pilobolus umbonatus]